MYRVTTLIVPTDITVRDLALVLLTDSNVMRTDVPLEAEQDVLHVYLNR